MADFLTLDKTPDFAMLPVEERNSVLDWQGACEAIDRADSKFAECRTQSMLHQSVKGWKNPRAVQKKYYAWLRAGRSWTVLVNWAKVPRLVSADDARVGEAFKAYAERNQRSNKRGWDAMLRDLRSGKPIEGVGTWRDVWAEKYPRVPVPERCPADWVPPGWTYETLNRRYPLTSYETALARRGAVAAREFTPPVYSTRVGLKPGQLYQFDDVWHDVLVAVPGINKRLVRPLEFACIDVATTNKIGYGLKPQVLRDDNSREGLGKSLFKATIAHVLCDVGFSPEGCVFVVEHGTASLSDKDKETITRITGGKVTFRTSNVLGSQVIAGQFAGQGHGNFKAKALLESSHRLIHYAAADMPAQTGGSSRGDKPEQLYGLEAYADKLLAAYQHIPLGLRKQIWYGGALPFATYRDLVAELYGIIYGRTDHKIEGWEDNGWVEERWSMDGVTGWQPVSAIDALPPFAAAAARQALVTPGFHKGVRLSPAEVWASAQPGLERIPLWSVIDFLGDDCYRKVTVGKKNLMEFQDRDTYGTERKIRFLAIVLQPDGSTARLEEGREYGIYTIPQDDSRAVVVDAERRNVIGLAPAWTAVSPTNGEAVAGAVAAAEKVRALQNAPVIARHQGESDVALSMRQANRTLLEGVLDDGLKPIAGGQELKLPRRSETKGKQMELMGALASLKTRKGEENDDDQW